MFDYVRTYLDIDENTDLKGVSDKVIIKTYPTPDDAYGSLIMTNVSKDENVVPIGEILMANKYYTVDEKIVENGPKIEKGDLVYFVPFGCTILKSYEDGSKIISTKAGCVLANVGV